jgi:hypothetical protein
VPGHLGVQPARGGQDMGATAPMVVRSRLEVK